MYKNLTKTLFLGKEVIYLPTCHSTNQEAASMLRKKKLIEGAILITDKQTAGRGQRGNKWESEPAQNLTFSIILRPKKLPIANSFDLNIIASLAICNLLKQTYGVIAKIKWPNDILYHRNKLAGILIENSIKGATIQHSIIGIGLNVNQEIFRNANASSLKVITNRNYDLQGVFENLVYSLEKLYMKLDKWDRPTLLKNYYQDLYGYEEERLFQTPKRVFRGIIKGIDHSGKLVVRNRDLMEHFDIKEVKFLE